MKDVEFKMRSGIAAEIFPNEVITFREKRPDREEGETAKPSDTIFLIFKSLKVSIEKQGRQQPNAKVWKGLLRVQILAARQIAQSIFQGHGEWGIG